MKKQQSGFTLIELVVVIVILGILAATAIPRFTDLSSDAKKAAKAGVIGGLNSAIAIAHAKYLAAGTSPATVQLDGGGSISLNGSGYPNIGAAGDYKDTGTCQTLIGDLLGSTSGLAIDFDTDHCTVTGDPNAYTSPISVISTGAS